MRGENKKPKGWVETTLGEVIKIVGGGTPRTTINEYWNGDIPWLSVVDFNNDNRWVYSTEKSITELGLQNSSTKLLNIGDIIISARGTVGAMAQLKKEMAFNQSCYGIREVQDVSDIDFLFYLIKFSLKQINRNVYGAVFDTITTKTFDVINIITPSLPEQQAIASILTSFDDKIELLQAQNQTLETMAQTIFKEWFGKYQVGDELPEGWRVGKLGDIIEFINGYAFKSKELLAEPVYNCLKVFKMGDIKKGGGFNPNKTKSYFKKEDALKIPKYILKDGDLLMSMTDMKDAISLLGHTALMIYDNEYIVNQRVGLIRAKNDIDIDFPFLYLLTNNEFFIANLRGRANSGVQVNLTTQAIKESLFIIPSKKTNTKFDMLAKPLFEKIKLNVTQIQTLQQTRDTLLPKLMSGELRVEEFI